MRPSTLAAGTYAGRFELITAGSGSQTTAFEAPVPVVNLTASPFGSGWTLAGLEQLVAQSGGALYVSGSGVTHRSPLTNAWPGVFP